MPKKTPAAAAAKANPAQMARLRQLEFFSPFSREELESLMPAVVERRYPPDTLIFSEGTPGDSLYIVEKGKISIFKKGKTGQPDQVLALFSDGDFFGEMSLAEILPRSASARTLEDTLLLEIRGESLLRWVSKDMATAMQVGTKIVRGLSERLRETSEHLDGLNRLTMALMAAQAPVEIWRAGGREFSRILGSEAAAGGALYSYNPYLEEFSLEGHWGLVPSDFLAGRRDFPEGSGAIRVFPLGSSAKEGSLVVFEPAERVLLKKIPVIETYVRVLYQAQLNAAHRAEEALKARLRDGSVST